MAYVPQITRIISHGSTQGLSPYFILFNAIYSNMQFAHTLLFAAYVYPDTSAPVLSLISDGRLKGSNALGGILGLLQVTVQWICSIALYVPLLPAFTFSPHSQILSVTLHASYPTIARPGSLSSNRTANSVAAMAFGHATIFLFPAMIIALPRAPARDWGNMLFVGFSLLVNTWIALFIVIFQFYPQYLEMRRMSGSPGSLSLLFLALQAVVILAVAIRWLLRLGPPTWEEPSVPLWYWYKWGNLPFSYILHAIGCAILLAAYLVTGRRGEGHDAESEAPLLG